MTLESRQHLLQDTYIVDELLGRGAFGEVYRATHAQLNTPRAIKVLRSDGPGVGVTDFSDYRRRFKLEIQVAARFDHAHIIKVYDLVEDNGVLYAVLEYAPNKSVKDLIAQGPVSVEQTVQIVLDCAAGLDALHEQDIVHRDVKPANILLGKEGQAKIADLGLVQVNEGNVSMRSELGSAAPIHPGTPNYRSPEHNSPEPLSPTSDVYSLGCVAFEMLTGKPWKIAMRKVNTARELRPDVPAWLDQIVQRMLSPMPGLRLADGSDPEKRYVSMEQLTTAIVAAQRQEAERIERQRKAEEAQRRELERIEQERLAEAEVARLKLESQEQHDRAAAEDRVPARPLFEEAEPLELQRIPQEVVSGGNHQPASVDYSQSNVTSPHVKMNKLAIVSFVAGIFQILAIIIYLGRAR